MHFQSTEATNTASDGHKSQAVDWRNAPAVLSAVIEHCIACGAPGVPALRVPHRDKEHIIRRCQSCGIHFAELQPVQGAAEDYYRKWYYGNADQRTDADNHYWCAAKRRSFLRVLNTVSDFVSTGRLLDVGCSFGYFLDLARDLGYDVLGVELSPGAAEFARRRFRLDVRCGILEDANLEANSCDVVTLLDILEHVPRPNDTLSEVARVIRPGGAVFVRVPSFDYLWLKHRVLPRRIQTRLGLSFSPEHLSFYTPGSLSSALARHGLKAVHVYPMPNFPAGSGRSLKWLAGSAGKIMFHATLGRWAPVVDLGVLAIAE